MVAAPLDAGHNARPATALFIRPTPHSPGALNNSTPSGASSAAPTVHSRALLPAVIVRRAPPPNRKSSTRDAPCHGLYTFLALHEERMAAPVVVSTDVSPVKYNGNEPTAAHKAETQRPALQNRCGRTRQTTPDDPDWPPSIAS